jgi:hypothetical protein
MSTTAMPGPEARLTRKGSDPAQLTGIPSNAVRN